jgi:hypothetical protein
MPIPIAIKLSIEQHKQPNHKKEKMYKQSWYDGLETHNKQTAEITHVKLRNLLWRDPKSG